MSILIQYDSSQRSSPISTQTTKSPGPGNPSPSVSGGKKKAVVPTSVTPPPYHLMLSADKGLPASSFGLITVRISGNAAVSHNGPGLFIPLGFSASVNILITF